jgi:hypothetical protein
VDFWPQGPLEELRGQGGEGGHGVGGGAGKGRGRIVGHLWALSWEATWRIMIFKTERDGTLWEEQ